VSAGMITVNVVPLLLLLLPLSQLVVRGSSVNFKEALAVELILLILEDKDQRMLVYNTLWS
jgi:hypothetical protein